MPTSTLQTNKSIVTLKRAKLKDLKRQHFNKTQIAKRLCVSAPFVRKWWGRDDLKADYRGWPRGRLRKRTKLERSRVVAIRKKLIRGEALFYGPDEVLREYQRNYPPETSPPRSFVAKVIKANCKVDRRRKRVKGGSRYLHYPAESIKRLGEIIQEVDFSGARTLKGEKQLVHLLFRVYTQPFKLPQVSRVSSPCGQETIDALVNEWKGLPLPDVLKMDNDTVFMPAGGHQEYWTERYICALLNMGITPLFTAFNKPWNNGSVEGVNSVFQRKVFGRHIRDSTHLDSQITLFNQTYLKRLKSLPAGDKLSAQFRVPLLAKVVLKDDLENPTVYFIRQALDKTTQGSAISVFKVPIKLDKQFLKQFVLVKLNVYRKILRVFYEIEPGKLKQIKKMSFPIKYH